MKKLFHVILGVLLAASIVGGGIFAFSNPRHIHVETSDATTIKSEAHHKVLVVYFAGDQKLETMAKYIANQTHGDLLKVTPKGKHVKDLDHVTSLSYKFSPHSASDKVRAITDYSAIYFGYPSSWKEDARPLQLFASKVDLSNLNVVPFGAAQIDTTKTEEKTSLLTKEVNRCIC